MMSTPLHPAPCTPALLASLLIAGSLASQRTFVVDGAGQGTHRTVQGAVDAARSGDRILILAGTYRENVKIDGKSLWLHGADGPPLVQTLTWTRHPKNATARVTHLDFAVPAIATRFGTPVTFAGNGNLLLERVRVRGPGTHIRMSGSVAIQSCVFGARPWRGYHSPFLGTTALTAENCGLLTINNCRLLGLPHGLSSFGWVSPGPGLVVRNSRVEIAGSTLLGGDGGRQPCGLDCTFGTNGAHGLVLFHCQARVRGPSATIGCGRGGRGSSFDGKDGNTLVAKDGSTVEVSGVTLRCNKLVADSTSKILRPSVPAPSLLMVLPFRFGHSAELRIGGEPKRLVVALLATRVRPLDLPFGTLYVDATSLLFPIPASLDSRGLATLRVSTSPDRDILGVPLYIQAVEIDGRLTMRLTGMAASAPGIW